MGRSEVDGPGGAGGVHRALARPDHQAREDQRRDAVAPAGTALRPRPSRATRRRAPRAVPRRSACRPAIGRQMTDVAAKAPMTIPTARSVECSGPRTYAGSTGSEAPIEMKASSAAMNSPAEAAALNSAAGRPRFSAVARGPAGGVRAARRPSRARKHRPGSWMTVLHAGAATAAPWPWREQPCAPAWRPGSPQRLRGVDVPERRVGGQRGPWRRAP